MEMKKDIYKELSNEELVKLTSRCLKELQVRSNLQDSLNEESYDEMTDSYAVDYDGSTFEAIIADFDRYLIDQSHFAIKSRKEHD